MLAARPSRVAAVAAAVAALVVAGSLVVPATADSEVRYAALGDSFTAGPLVPLQGGHPPGCLRSDHNYPHLVAAAAGMALADVSCSGARTDHLFGPQAVLGGPNPPQLDAVGPGTGVVTVGIGGNDIGFAEIVTTCFAALPLGQPGQDR